MKRLAILLALLALPAVVGCGSSSEAKTASAPKKSSKRKSSGTSKSKYPKPGNTQPKGYKPPQTVWGPLMLEDYLKDLKSSDPKKRESACNGLFNQRSGAREALPALKKLVKTESNAKVKTAAKRAIQAIEEG